MMDFGYLIGWAGACIGITVPLFQIRKLLKSKDGTGVSILTYISLECALLCYLLHAIYIRSEVFTVIQSVNLCTNGFVLGWLLKAGRKR